MGNGHGGKMAILITAALNNEGTISDVINSVSQRTTPTQLRHAYSRSLNRMITYLKKKRKRKRNSFRLLKVQHQLSRCDREPSRKSGFNEDDILSWRFGLLCGLFGGHTEGFIKMIFPMHAYFTGLSLPPAIWLQVMSSVLDVERPLVQGQLAAIDALLRKAEDSLNWSSQGQDTFFL